MGLGRRLALRAGKARPIKQVAYSYGIRVPEKGGASARLRNVNQTLKAEALKKRNVCVLFWAYFLRLPDTKRRRFVMRSSPATTAVQQFGLDGVVRGSVI